MLGVGAFAGVAAADVTDGTFDFLMGMEGNLWPGWGDFLPHRDGGKPEIGPDRLAPVGVPMPPLLDPLVPNAPPPPEPEPPIVSGMVEASMRRNLDDIDVGVHSWVNTNLQSIFDLLGVEQPPLPQPLQDALSDPSRIHYASDIATNIGMPGVPDPSHPRAPDSPLNKVALGLDFQGHHVGFCEGVDCPDPLSGDSGDAAAGAPASLAAQERAGLGVPLPAFDGMLPAASKTWTGAPQAPGASRAPAAVADGSAAYPAQSSILVSAPDLLALTVLALGALVPAGALLYSRLRRDTALENATRLRIYQNVSVNPGLSIQELARRAATSHSTAAYHLERLTRAKMVVPTHDGNKVRFYPNGGRFSEQERKLLPCLENAETTHVLETVLQRPWTYRAELASLLDVTATTVSWHLKRILSCGVVVEVREGRNAHLFVDRNALRELCLGLRVKVPPTSPVCEVAERLLAQLGTAVQDPRVAAAAGPAPLALPPLPMRMEVRAPAPVAPPAAPAAAGPAVPLGPLPGATLL